MDSQDLPDTRSENHLFNRPLSLFHLGHRLVSAFPGKGRSLAEHGLTLPRRDLMRTLGTTLLFVFLVTACGPTSVRPVVKGGMAPDISFVDLSTGTNARLSDLRGKIVFADFWASWCAPCQPTMAKLQTYRESHPEWGESVVLLAISVDDSQEKAVKHLQKKGWDQARNAWLDPHDGQNSEALAYISKGIPAGYLIGRDGNIVLAGHPSQFNLAESIKELLAGP